MRAWVAVLFLVPVLSGCLDAGEVFGSDPSEADCNRSPESMTYWLGGSELLPALPDATGRTVGNGFSNAFIVDEADEWLSAPLEDGIRILGDVTLDVWVESTGAPAVFTEGGPLSGGVGDPTSGWQFFTQFGSDRGFAGSYHNVYGDTFSEPGTVTHYVQTFTMPEGGLVVESGDRLRLLLTSLVLDDPTAGGSHYILWGRDTPSAVSFNAVCYPDREWAVDDIAVTDIALPGNQGLLTGAIPAQEGVNVQSVDFHLREATERLTISLEQTGTDLSPPKNDMDVTVLDASGEPVWSIGSPYVDESGTFWKANLDALMPPGEYTVQVNSYSGKGYEGVLTIVQESPLR